MRKNLEDLLKNKGYGNIQGHQEKYIKIAELLGFESVVACIPFDLETLEKSYKQDPYFNTKITPINAWDLASGFKTDRYGNCSYIGSELTRLYQKNGVNCFSNSDGVCILKCVARKILNINIKE